MTQSKIVLAFSVFCTFFFFQKAKAQRGNWKMQPVNIQTRWAKNVHPENALQDYPRPQLLRANWQNLNGLWLYAITDIGASAPTEYNGTILVPFPLESALSGVQKVLQPNQRLWYKTSFKKPEIKNNNRLLLHFGAVDWHATVYVNGIEVGNHIGGYQHFSFDITDALKNEDNELVVSVLDPTDQGYNPHGKQALHPQGIMYTSSSGIWQTVWMETVPIVSISSLFMTPDIDKGILRLVVQTTDISEDYTIEAIASNGSSIKGKVRDSLSLLITNARLWTPDDPYLYRLNVRLLHKGKIVDTVGSYFGMRKIAIQKDEQGIERLFLNNKYTFQLGVLDQGFWPDGLYTAPTDEALQFDILAIKNMGYNTIRKHIKVEPARWYYHADRIGMLVWQDMVNPPNESPQARDAFEKETKEIITQLNNHPSIVTWVVFNEGWGAYDQARVTKMVKDIDPSRVINGHSGENYYRASPQNVKEKWANSDMTDEHIYPGPGIPPALPGKVRVLGEWGGVGVSIAQHTWKETGGWGYIKELPSTFARKYELMVKHLKIYEEEGLSASIYTEPFDVELEENGLMTYDRSVIKITPEKLREIHSMVLPQVKNHTDSYNIFTAQIADTTNPYQVKLRQYLYGNRNLVFIKNLAAMAVAQEDRTTANRICEDYINTLKGSISDTDITFIQSLAVSSKDIAFRFIIKHAEEVAKLKDGSENIGLQTIRRIIKNERIVPIFQHKDVQPDWKRIKNVLTTEYGKAGERVTLEAMALYHYTRKDVKEFVNTKTEILLKYPTAISNWTLNSDAWFVFENAPAAEQALLQTALKWSYKIIQEEPGNAANLDTYANLLYKMGRSAEALSWQEKAVKANPSFKEIVENYEKMKNGKPTWE